jgi:hypothetical protein
MARSRNIKPAFFLNEQLVELPYSTRLLFIGLWCLADREGRLENRPKKIKMQLFPADDLDIPEALLGLYAAKLITLYTIDSIKYIQIDGFNKHQNPHHKEADSTIPACTLPDKPEALPSTTVLIPDSLNLIPDSGLPEKILVPSVKSRFLDFYAVYPKKKDKAKAEAAWKRHKLDSIADKIINDVINRSTNESSWQDKQYIPLPTTYINGKRWEDEINTEVYKNAKTRQTKPTSCQQLEENDRAGQEWLNMVRGTSEPDDETVERVINPV